MQQYFFVLFNDENKSFFRDSQLGNTTDMLMAQRYYSKGEAKEQLKYFIKKDKWTVRKIIVTLEEE